MRLNPDEIALVSLAYIKALRMLSIQSDSDEALGLIDTVYLLGQSRKNRSVALRDIEAIANDAASLVLQNSNYVLRNRKLNQLINLGITYH